MFFIDKTPRYIKIVDLAEKMEVEVEELYVWLSDLERHGVTDFKKSPLGYRMVEEEQIKIIEEYALLKQHFSLPVDATSVLKNMNIFNEEKEDFTWTRGLKNVIWRHH